MSAPKIRGNMLVYIWDATFQRITPMLQSSYQWRRAIIATLPSLAPDSDATEDECDLDSDDGNSNAPHGRASSSSMPDPAARHAISNARDEAFVPAAPRRHPPQSPCLSIASGSIGRTVHDLEVQSVLHHLDMLSRNGKPLYRPRCSDGAYALAALRVYNLPHDGAFPLFWSMEHRQSTAHLIQRVLDSGERLVIPMRWKGVAAALEGIDARGSKRNAEPGIILDESPSKVRRVTRQSARSEPVPMKKPPRRAVTAAATGRCTETRRTRGAKRGRSEESAETLVTPPSREMSADTVVGETERMKGISRAAVLDLTFDFDDQWPRGGFPRRLSAVTLSSSAYYTPRSPQPSPRLPQLRARRLPSPPPRGRPLHRRPSQTSGPGLTLIAPLRTARSARTPPSVASTSVVPSTVPVRRPRTGKINTRQCDALHDKYHAAGRLLKYSGDARFWSTYAPSHKEYRPLANPPLPNSPYYKYGGLIARLELLDALVCFTYSIWNREYCRRSCNRETWRTIEGFLVWCKQKWATEEGTTDPEKAFLGLIWMIEGCIHARKLVYATSHGTPLDRDTEQLMAATRAAVAVAATEASAGALAPKSGSTPVMLPSPASLAPSANSTPTNRDGTPSSTTTGNTAPATAMVPSTLPSVFLSSQYRHTPVAPHVAAAMEAVTVPIGPRLLNEFKNEQLGIANAAICMNHSQTYLTLPIMARHFPTTFARMVSSTLSANEEHEPDFEDEEGELFWPGQSITGEGLGWVCLMGKAMIKEFGKAYSYRGLAGVVPKPRPEEEAGRQPAGSTPLTHNSPMPR
ncbi:hypothetical protein MKEN_00686400 [Mycena kentingensis (nom. inval.)]|nr:hypothetical protein MKEN_00686400 [Mycena kentingensis (nom. inval.)]